MASECALISGFNVDLATLLLLSQAQAEPPAISKKREKLNWTETEFIQSYSFTIDTGQQTERSKQETG